MQDHPAAPAPRGSITALFGGPNPAALASLDGSAGVGAGGSGVGISTDGQTEDIEVSVATPHLGCGIKDAIGGVVVVSLVEGGEGERLGMKIGDLIHSVNVMFSPTYLRSDCSPSLRAYRLAFSSCAFPLVLFGRMCCAMAIVFLLGGCQDALQARRASHAVRFPVQVSAREEADHFNAHPASPAGLPAARQSQRQPTPAVGGVASFGGLAAQQWHCRHGRSRRECARGGQSHAWWGWHEQQ